MQFELAALVIGLREGLEAFVVLGIVVGMLRRFGHPRKANIALVGAGLAVLASALIALAFHQAFERHVGDALFEFIVGVAALAILVYMIVWMQRHTAQITGGMHDRLKKAAEQGRWALVASLGFIVVFREGIETVAFFAARSADGVAWVDLLLAGTLGFGVAAALALGIFRLSLRVNLRHFFAVTGVLLIVVSAGILVSTLHEAEEYAEDTWDIEETPLVWDLRASFPHQDRCIGGTDANGTCMGQVVAGNPLAGMLRGLVGYSDHPTVVQVAGWLAWVGGFGGWYAMSLRKRPGAPRTD